MSWNANCSIEFARNMLGLKGANSTEFDSKTNYPVVALITNGKIKPVKLKGEQLTRI